MGYYGGAFGGGGGGPGHYERLHANQGSVRADNQSISGPVDGLILPANMAATDRLAILLRVWQIGGTASPDFAEFHPWLGTPDGGTFLWANVDTSALHYLGYLVDTSQGGNGLVVALDQRNGGTTNPSFWTNVTSDFAHMGELAGVTLGLEVDAYLMGAGYHDWGWAWRIDRIRSH